jgi:hypothetical protein
MSPAFVEQLISIRKIAERIHRLVKGLSVDFDTDAERRQHILAELRQVRRITERVGARVAIDDGDHVTVAVGQGLGEFIDRDALLGLKKIRRFADIAVTLAEKAKQHQLDDFIENIDPAEIEDIVNLLRGVPEPQTQASVANQNGGAITGATPQSPETPDSEVFIYGKLRIDPTTKTITLRRKSETITNARAFNALLLIARAKGNVVSSQEIQKIPGCKGRPDKVLSPLPEWVRELIPSQPGRGGGYALTLPK